MQETGAPGNQVEVTHAVRDVEFWRTRERQGRRVMEGALRMSVAGEVEPAQWQAPRLGGDKGIVVLAV